MRSLFLLAIALLTLAGLETARRPPTPPHIGAGVTPAASRVFTSTRSVTSLLLEEDGTLWAGTTGGVLRRSPSGQWRKWTRQDGLPSEEVRQLSVSAAGEVQAAFPRAAAVWHAGVWQSRPEAGSDAAFSAAETCPPVVWNGMRCTAGLTGLTLGDGPDARHLPLPPSAGTHVSALLPQGAAVWAALYGDGLWERSGDVWKPVLPGLPPEAREITALAARGTNVWVGTRQAGLWRHGPDGWRRETPPQSEPEDHNIQSLASYDGCLYASTLQEGLVIKTPSGWHQVTVPSLSSAAPRQLVVFGGRLFVRHGSGVVDRWDGTRWARNVFAFLPRGGVSALATDGTRLYAAQWGGWSETDGHIWTHHLTLPALRGQIITALCPEGSTLWLGTQGRSVAEVSRAAGTVRWHDERAGLTDDWITCLAQIGPTLCAGTFVGGLNCRTARSGPKTRWSAPAALWGSNITALAPDGTGGVWAATRTGVWHRSASGLWATLESFLEPEAQALLPVPGGLWIGTRTGLDFVRDADRPPAPNNGRARVGAGLAPALFPINKRLQPGAFADFAGEAGPVHVIPAFSDRRRQPVID